MHFSPSGWLTLRKFVEFIQSWLSVEPFPFSSVLKSLFKWFIWWLISDKHLIPFNNLHKYLGSTPADTPVQQEPGNVSSQPRPQRCPLPGEALPAAAETHSTRVPFCVTAKMKNYPGILLREKWSPEGGSRPRSQASPWDLLPSKGP